MLDHTRLHNAENSNDRLNAAGITPRSRRHRRERGERKANRVRPEIRLRKAQILRLDEGHDVDGIRRDRQASDTLALEDSRPTWLQPACRGRSPGLRRRARTTRAHGATIAERRHSPARRRAGEWQLHSEAFGRQPNIVPVCPCWRHGGTYLRSSRTCKNRGSSFRTFLFGGPGDRAILGP